jgi:hypothetical protein
MLYTAMHRQCVVVAEFWLTLMPQECPTCSIAAASKLQQLVLLNGTPKEAHALHA